MERRLTPLSEDSYVTKTLAELVGLLRETQPSQSYPGDWYHAVQIRNSINRITQDYEEACSHGFQRAEYLAPSLLSDWPQLVQFSADIDNIRSAFIQRCDRILNHFRNLANYFEIVDSPFSSELRAAINNIEQIRDQYMQPLARRKATIRQ